MDLLGWDKAYSEFLDGWISGYGSGGARKEGGGMIAESEGKGRYVGWKF